MYAGAKSRHQNNPLNTNNSNTTTPELDEKAEKQTRIASLHKSIETEPHIEKKRS